MVSDTRINTYTTSGQDSPSMAAFSDGSFVVIWQSLGQDGASHGIYGQRYDATGAAQGSEFRVNTYTASNQQEPSVTSLANGGFIVTWQSNGQNGAGSSGIYVNAMAATALHKAQSSRSAMPLESHRLNLQSPHYPTMVLS